MAAKYQMIELPPGVNNRVIKRVADNAFIPFDEGNKDYQEYKQWLAEGNQPDPVPQPVVERNV
jgi:hypothetical protein